MLKPTKMLVGMASLFCTAASFSIAVSPMLGTARQARTIAGSPRAGQAVAARAGVHDRAAQRPAVMFETLGDACKIVLADGGTRSYAAYAPQTFDLVE